MLRTRDECVARSVKMSDDDVPGRMSRWNATVSPIVWRPASYRMLSYMERPPKITEGFKCAVN